MRNENIITLTDKELKVINAIRQSTIKQVVVDKKDNTVTYIETTEELGGNLKVIEKNLHGVLEAGNFGTLELGWKDGKLITLRKIRKQKI